MKNIFSHPWFRIFLAYLLFGILYIYFSDKLVNLMVNNAETLTRIQTIKGWLFILASALLIAWLVREETHKQNRLNTELSERVEQLKELNKALDSARKAAEENDRLKTAFLNNMSHEIRTPLNGIIGFSSLLADETLDAEKKFRYSGIVRSSGNQLTRTIDDILDISKIESGQLQLVSEEFDLHDFLDTIVQYTRDRIRESDKNLSLETEKDFASFPTRVLYDRSRLFQILTHILDNAVKFTPEGVIRISSRIKGDKLEFAVSDSGPGISPNDHLRIFDRFVQCHNEEIKAVGGNGIGLTIVRGLVELFKGEILLRSEPGKGSEFTITLPFVESTYEKRKEYAGRELERFAGKTVLIADDVDTSSALLKEILEGINVKVILAANGEECVKLFSEEPSVDLVLMDILMPVMDGYEAVKILKKNKPGVPVIAQTAYAMQNDRVKALAAGFDDYIPKPISRNLLMTVLNKLL